jgi:hypothetical protein
MNLETRSRSRSTLNTIDDNYNNNNNTNNNNQIIKSINQSDINLEKIHKKQKIISERIDINSINTIKSIKLNKEKIVNNIKYIEFDRKESKEFYEIKNENEENKNKNENFIINIRKDMFGNIIKKGSKKHKVSFIDYKKNQRGKLISEIEIESYKKYNKQATMRDYNYDDVNCQCSCFLF